MPAISEDLRDLLQPVAERYASIRLGVFLHGSHSRGEAGPRSDVDVLGLSATEHDDDRISAEQACFDALAARPWPGTLDLKIIPAERFAADPWVDLRTARWLFGEPWHQILPPRTRDQAARESIAVLGSLFGYRDFTLLDDPHELAKPVGRLCSVLAAPKDSPLPDDLRRRVHAAADAVAAVLRVHVEQGLLGPICTAAGAKAIAEYDEHGPLRS